VSDADSEEPSSPNTNEAESVEGDVVPLEEVREVARAEAQEFLQFRASFHAGPLPDHESFACYERTHAGTAERIVTMTEKEQSERHHLQRVGLYAAIGVRYLGMIFAVVICLVALFVGASLIRDDKGVEGLVFLLAGLGPIVAAFLFRRNMPGAPRLPASPNANNGS